MADVCRAAPWRGSRLVAATLLAALLTGGGAVSAQTAGETERATVRTPSPDFPGGMGEPTIAPGGAGERRSGEPAGDQPADPPGFTGDVGIDSGNSPGGSGPSGIVAPPQTDTAPSGADPLSE